MRAARWLFVLGVLNAAACGSKVVVGELGSQGTSSGGATQTALGGSAGAPTSGSGDMLSTGTAGQSCGGTLNVAAPAITTACPDAMPDSGAPCDDQAENSICVWQIGYAGTQARGYRALGCYAGSKGKVWSGGEQPQNNPLGPLDMNCPKQAPALGSSCPTFGPKDAGETCIYPSDYCECSSIEPGKWLCTDQLGGTFSPPAPVKRVCTPPELDETGLVMNLGPKLAGSYCNWLAQLTGKVAVPVGNDSPGIADSYEYHSFSTPELNLCLADLPTTLCAQNLVARGNQCTATLAELNDCVETILGAKAQGWVGHGCAPLLANPSCAGVLVQPLSDADGMGGAGGASSTPPCTMPPQ